VDSSGVPEQHSGLTTGSGWGTSGVRVASHGTLGAVAYSTTRAPSASDGEIFLVRVGADGSLPDGPAGVPLTEQVAGEQYAPGVAWNGAEFLAVFQDTRSQPGLIFFPRSDLYGARLGADGSTPDSPGGFPVETSPLPELQPAVAGSGGESLVAATHLRGGAVGALRIGARLLSAGGTPPSPVRFLDSRTLAWGGSTPGVVFDVLRGELPDLRADGSIIGAECIADDHAGTELRDDTRPSAGGGLYYLVREDTPGGPVGSYDVPGAAGQVRSRDDGAGPLACTHVP
jgi:hypothetical protein